MRASFMVPMPAVRASPAVYAKKLQDSLLRASRQNDDGEVA
jgi:hypothetical protein